MSRVFRCILIFFLIKSAFSDDENKALRLIESECEQLQFTMNEANIASWNHAVNVTDENQKLKTAAQEKLAKFSKDLGLKVKEFNYKTFKNETLKRLMKNLANIGDAILEPEDFRALQNHIAEMQSHYAKVKVPSYRNKNELYSLEPEITTVLETSRDPDELKYYWTQWYDLAGVPCKENFFKYAELRNKAAKLNGFADGADYWLDSYEDPNFEQQIEDILEQIKPLYQNLHGYVRHKLHEHYGPDHIDLNKPIPMHLLGNMWGQKWDLSDIVLPYKDVQKIDTTAEMIQQNYTPKRMFEMAEEFFKSLNLSALPDSFWKKSIIEKPNDGREIICHASAWDFSMNDDVRIKMCTRVSMESFITIHHELGHVEYYLQYNKLPIPFRAGANPGFHEAIGDTIALSVATPKHLHRVGLLANDVEDIKGKINQLLTVGLQKLALLPFAYAMDKFRYEVFRGNIQPENANCHFWNLRVKYGGIGPASARSNRDFDITAKYHASADVEYMRYFVSNIIQFQFHRAACIKAGEYDADNSNDQKSLDNCDIYQSANAGNSIQQMLSLGSSKPWNDALEVMTGERKLDAAAFLEYFQPLNDWLVETNKKLGVKIGWTEDKADICSDG